MAIFWAVRVYLPDRRRLTDAHVRRAGLVNEIRALSEQVARLVQSERRLLAEDPYLWERVARRRLRWTAPDEHGLETEPGTDVR